MLLLLQYIINDFHAKPRIYKITVLAEGIILPSVLYRISQLLISRAVPGILQGHFRQIPHIRHLKIITAADPQLPAGSDPHIRIRHETGFLVTFSVAALLGALPARLVNTSFRYRI